MSAGTTLALEASRKALRETRELEREIRDLKRQVEHLTLVSGALMEVLRDQLGIPGEQIEAKIREIDLRDGQLDGKFQPPAKSCGACGRVSGARNATCIYCGAPLAQDPLSFGV
jgi:hypothetical protein